jgi:hypothetical protein
VVGISAVTGTRAVKASGHVPYASGGGGELAGKDNAAKDANQLVHARRRRRASRPRQRCKIQIRHRCVEELLPKLRECFES